MTSAGITLFDLVFGFLGNILSTHKDKLPAELVSAVQAAVDSWAAHRDDLVTKANLEAQRG